MSAFTEQRSVAVTDRCAAYRSTVGRCQLAVDHQGPHALSADGAYLTWLEGPTYRWSKSRPAGWLADLPWVTGHHPTLVFGELSSGSI
jgi:hypothetical protein